MKFVIVFIFVSQLVGLILEIHSYTNKDKWPDMIKERYEELFISGLTEDEVNKQLKKEITLSLIVNSCILGFLFWVILVL